MADEVRNPLMMLLLEAGVHPTNIRQTLPRSVVAVLDAAWRESAGSPLMTFVLLNRALGEAEKLAVVSPSNAGGSGNQLFDRWLAVARSSNRMANDNDEREPVL